MEDEPSFLWESNQDHSSKINESKTNENEFSNDVEDLFNELHGITVEELEVELRRKEKELYLCSRLGLFLSQEVDELITQRRGIVSDHTKLLLELQEYKDSRRSYLDISDGTSEHNPSVMIGKTQANHGDADTAAAQPSDSNAAQNPTSLTSSVLDRTCSLESLDAISNAESVMTSVSSIRELQQDMDFVQKSHDRITKFEVKLDKTRAKYRSLMTNYAHKLKELSKELGSCVFKARPYFEAVRKAKKCQLDTQQAAIEYKRAVNLQKAARDMVKVAEDRVMAAEDKLDPTWQEMLNQANIKVNEASREKNRVHALHLKAAKLFQIAEEKKIDLQQKLQRSVVKSKPYFEVQREFHDRLEATTKKLNMLELRLMEARQTYSVNLSRLKRSDANGKSSEAMRSLTERGMGVGAENPLRLLDPSNDGLPKPDLEFLERPNVETTDGGAPKSTDDDLTAVDLSTPVRTKLRYNPYDLLYLTDIGSDSPSEVDSDSDDEYLQDF